MRTILDCAAEGDTDRNLLLQALEQGLRRGLITRAELKRARSMDGLPPWLLKMLENATRKPTRPHSRSAARWKTGSPAPSGSCDAVAGPVQSVLLRFEVPVLLPE